MPRRLALSVERARGGRGGRGGGAPDLAEVVSEVLEGSLRHAVGPILGSIVCRMAG